MIRLFLALGLVIGLIGSLAAQDQKLPFEGSEYFRFFLHKKNLKPLSNSRDAIPEPSKTIIICLGDAQWINDEFGGPGGQAGQWLDQYLRLGGSVLIATDEKCQPNRNKQFPNWEEKFGLAISGRLLTAKADECFNAQDGRPFVKPRRPIIGFLDDSPYRMFKEIRATGENAITTDRPSELSILQTDRVGFQITPLASYPDSAKGIDDNIAVAPKDNLFAVSIKSQQSQGRLLVIADHSVFVNGLMKFEANEETGELRFLNANIKFTNQMIDWLIGANGERTHCLFVSNGQIFDQFAKEVIVPPKDIPPMIPPIPPDVLINLLLQNANPVLADLQERIQPNSFLDRVIGGTTIRRWLILVATLALIGLIWSRISRATRKNDPSRWMALVSLGGLLPKGSTNQRKRDDLIDTGNVYEAARWRIRDRFDRIGGQPTESGEMPPILMADNSRQAMGLEPMIRRLWLIGYGTTPVTVPVSLWDEFNLDLERAIKLARQGIWTFAPLTK